MRSGTTAQPGRAILRSLDSANLDVVRAVFAAFGQRDADALVEYVDPEVVFEPVSTPVQKREPYRGHDGLREYLRDLEETWDEFEVTVSELRESGDKVVALGRIKAIATGAAYMTDSPAGFVWHLRDGKVVWGKVFTNVNDALEAGGVD